MRPLIVGVLGAILLLSSTAQADRGKARELLKKGNELYELELYDDAIVKYKDGFAQHPDAEFLFRIGESHRNAGHARRAIEYYNKYLKVSPKASERAEIEGHIAELQKAAAAEPAEPEEMLPLSPSGGGDQPAEKPKLTLLGSETVAPVNKPIWQRWPLWVGIAAGVVVVGAVTAVAVVAATPNVTLLPAENVR